jgi:hypothetical protein
LGFSISWVAIRGRVLNAVWDELGVQPTGERDEFPDFPLAGTELPGGWYLVCADTCDAPFLQEDVLERLSSGGEAVICSVEEHVMYSESAGWFDGRQIWSVRHDAQESIGHLEASGEPPPTFITIRNRLASEQEAAGGEQASVDYIFDIPVQLAEAVTGFRHDKVLPELGENPYEALE